MDCVLCKLLNEQVFAAIKQGDTIKLRKAQQLIARHKEEHEQQEREEAFAKMQSERQDETMSTPDQPRL
jgi:hypothetical protein